MARPTAPTIETVADADPALEPLRRLPAGHNRVALTFDDGPDPRFTPKLLDLLAASGVTATFFVIVSAAVRHSEVIERMLRDGHAIGSHGWTHRHPWLQSASSARRQVDIAGQALATLTGQPTRWFRPPHGRLRSATKQAAAAAGQRVALWSTSAVDWGPWATPRRVARRLQMVADGDIVLMHDGRNRINRPDVTLELLPRFLSTLAATGLQPVALR